MASLTFILLLWCTPGAGQKPQLVIESMVDGATVQLDGKVVGKTPLAALSVAAGKHTLRVSRLGYLPYSDTILVQGDKTITVEADLLPVAGVLEIKANVRGVRVFIDDVEIGKTPLEYELKPGKHRLRLSQSGYTDILQTVEAVAGEILELDLKLAGGVPDDDLQLVPLKPADQGDDLAIEPLTKKKPAAATDKAQHAAQAATVAPDAPSKVTKAWYTSWWALSVASAVVVSGAALSWHYLGQSPAVPLGTADHPAAWGL